VNSSLVYIDVDGLMRAVEVMLEDDRHLIQQVAVEYSGDRTLTKLADKDGNQQSRQYQTMQRRRRLCGVFVGLPLSYNSPAEMSLQESDQSDESLLTLQVSLSQESIHGASAAYLGAGGSRTGHNRCSRAPADTDSRVPLLGIGLASALPGKRLVGSKNALAKHKPQPGVKCDRLGRF
jgi:hypothetical protein